MGFLAWVGLILGIIKAIPEAISFFKTIIELIRNLKKTDPSFSVRAAMRETSNAVAHLKQTGDVTKLSDVARELKKRCEGVGCPVDFRSPFAEDDMN
jgi:hypothetical protein